MCCGSQAEVLQGAVWIRRGGGWEEGLLTHLGAGGGERRGGLLTSGQPCKSRKPRRWPSSKLCPVNRGDFWQRMKRSNREAQTTSLHFFLLPFGCGSSAPHGEQFTRVKRSILTREFWSQITVHCAQLLSGTEVQSGIKVMVDRAFCSHNNLLLKGQNILRGT